MRRNNYLIVFVVSFVLVACGEKPFYTKNISFKDNTWNVDQKARFDVQVKDTSSNYGFRLVLRSTTDYPYSNLWIFMKTIAPDGSEAREPYQFRITDEGGYWLGERSGTTVETELSFASRKLPAKGKYTFIIEQAITEKEVDEVLDLVFEVSEEKAN
jgi:gliding motility-associated lipoprotein GldH